MFIQQRILNVFTIYDLHRQSYKVHLKILECHYRRSLWQVINVVGNKKFESVQKLYTIRFPISL